MRLYTIGHSNRPIKTFQRLLLAHGVEQVADVRRFPGSSKHPQFNREALTDHLAQVDVEYAFLGESLGGRRPQSKAAGDSPNRGLTNASFRRFADYMSTPEFGAGVRTLLDLANRRVVCFMCSEGWFVRCHRKLISDYLTANDIEVRHISSGVRADLHRISSEAVAAEGRVTYPFQ